MSSYYQTRPLVRRHRRSPTSVLQSSRCEASNDAHKRFWKTSSPTNNSRKISSAATRSVLRLLLVAISLTAVTNMFAPHWQPSRMNAIPFRTNTGPLYSPRVTYLERHWKVGDRSNSIGTFFVQDPLLRNENKTIATTTLLEPNYTKDMNECIPMEDWQIQSYPTCNAFHEIDLLHIRTKEISLLGEGWFRTTWKFQPNMNDTAVVLKTLRIIREFTPEYYELHRRDAVAMERLTHSRFIVNVYGYCGQSAINEFADFNYPGIKSMEDFDRRLRGRNDHKTLAIKLKMATSIAIGVAHIHQAGRDSNDRAMMVHYDLNPRNVALFVGGRPKINDFNIAEFLTYNPKTNETCGFPSRMHQPWWRAPEEMYNETVLLDEKVDVYSLGSLIFHILTTHSPRGKMNHERTAEVQQIVRTGKRPILMEPFASSNDTITVAFRKVMDLCFTVNPRERGTAQQVVDIFLEALDSLN